MNDDEVPTSNVDEESAEGALPPAAVAVTLDVDDHRVDDRVLLWGLSGRDARLVRDLLGRDGVANLLCPTPAAFWSELAAGAGAAVVASEALTVASATHLTRLLAAQPVWSDLPLVVLTSDDAPPSVLLDRLVRASNVTLLVRAAPLATLRSVLRGALRARRRQYQARDLLARAADADRREDELLVLLGQELRAPLAAIREAASRLEHLDGEAGTARMRDVVHRQSERLLRTIDDLLEVARLAAHRAPPAHDPVVVAPPPPTLAASPSTPPCATADAPRGRVVLVEDNDDIRACMVELLAAWGFAVEDAADGRAGLDLLHDDPPPVAIVDVGLPKLDGYDLARRVRARHGPHRVRLIAMTGYGQAQDRERAFQAGFDEHLVKPVDPDALAALLAGPCEGSRSAVVA